jgi:hypothetical protein
MNIQDNDFILATYEGNKPQLIRVVDAKRRKGYVEYQNYDPDTREEVITYTNESVVCVLGKTPRIGTAFGTKIEPYIRTIESKRWGQIQIYRKLEKKDIEPIKIGLKKAYLALKKVGAHSVLPVQIQIRNKKGKYAGAYYSGTKKKPHHIMLCPEVFSDVKYNKYVILHEVAHAIWFTQVPNVIKAKWLALYTKRLALRKIKQDQLESLGKSLLDYGSSVNDYLKELASDEDKLLIKEVMTWLKSKRHFDQHDVKLLLDTDPQLLMEYWPNRAELIDLRPDISEYSLLNVREFFAESIAFHLTDKTLPKDVVKAINYTLPRLTDKQVDNDQ